MNYFTKKICFSVLPAAVILLAAAQLEARDSPFFGWTCHSVGENLPVYVDVQQNARGGGYSMKVQAEVSLETQSLEILATFDSVALEISPANIGFAGSDRGLLGELDIDVSSGRLGDLDSRLRLGAKAPAYAKSVKLVCDRTR